MAHLFYTIARVFQLSHGSDMMCEMRNRKPEHTLLPIQYIHRRLAFDGTLSYTQWWKSKLEEVMAWRIEPPTFRLGVRLRKKVRHSNHSAAEDYM